MKFGYLPCSSLQHTGVQLVDAYKTRLKDFSVMDIMNTVLFLFY